MNSLEDGLVSPHGKVIKALETLLVGTCVELTFGTSTKVGQKREMNHCVATGVRLLGTTSNETVMSILSTQVVPSHKPAAVQLCRDIVSMTQQNSNDPNSSSFLYDTKSQITDTLDQKTFPDLLRLESFALESQSGRGPVSDVSHVMCSVDDEQDDGVQTSEEIVHELESEWENTQKHQLSHVDADLALSEEVLSELQESFDHSRRCSPAPTRSSVSLSAVTSATVTPLSSLRGTHLTWSSWRLPSPGGCCGTPELFSSRKKLTQRGRVGELPTSLSFTPELFGPTPLVCRCHDHPSTFTISSTPLSLSGKTNTPQEGEFVDDSTSAAQPDDSGTSQQLLFSVKTCNGREYPNIRTPQSQHKHSFAFECTISSPDLFS